MKNAGVAFTIPFIPDGSAHVYQGKTMKTKHKKLKAELLYCKYCEHLEDAELHFSSHHVNKSNGVNYGRDCHRLIYK